MEAKDQQESQFQSFLDSLQKLRRREIGVAEEGVIRNAYNRSQREEISMVEAAKQARAETVVIVGQAKPTTDISQRDIEQSLKDHIRIFNGAIKLLSKFEGKKK